MTSEQLTTKPPCIITIYHDGEVAYYHTTMVGASILLQSMRQPIDPANVKVAALAEDGTYTDTLLDLLK